MKEFDKIYIAKYYELIEKWEFCRDFKITKTKLDCIVKDLKQTGLYDVYRKISDDEWEKLEKKKDSYIINLYMPKIPRNHDEIFSKLVAEFREEIPDYRYVFEMYKPEDYTFEFDYFYKEDFEGEEWKQIGKMNYEISNYGRIKNTQTKKLKALKKQRFGMQVLLWQNGKSYTITISRLVANMFIRKVKDTERVSHINGNIRDNYYKNLKIVLK